MSLTSKADKILRQAGYGTHGQELRSKGKRSKFKRKTMKQCIRPFEAHELRERQSWIDHDNDMTEEAIWYEGLEHMQSIKQEIVASKGI